MSTHGGGTSLGEGLRLRAAYERRLAALADEVEAWLRAGELGGDANGRLDGLEASGPRGLERVVRERLIPDDETAYAILEGSSAVDARAPRDAAVAMALRQLVGLARLRVRARDFLDLPIAPDAGRGWGAGSAGRRAPTALHAEGPALGFTPRCAPAAGGRRSGNPVARLLAG